MQALYANAVMTGFAEALTADGFAVEQGKWSTSRTLLFHRKQARVACFILLECSAKRDAFTFSIAWSTKDVFPIQLALRLLMPDDAPVDGELFFRAPWLWMDNRVDTWWELSRESDLPAALADAIDRFRRWGLPYFAEVAAQLANPVNSV